MAYPMFGACPVCGEPMQVTRLYCRHCDTTVEGHLELGRLFQLTAKQLSFVETFLRCEGKINRAEQELGVSFPTVRNRLREVIRALGYEVDEELPLSPDERRGILEQLAAGEISSDEAIGLLKVSG